MSSHSNETTDWVDTFHHISVELTFLSGFSERFNPIVEVLVWLLIHDHIIAEHSR